MRSRIGWVINATIVFIHVMTQAYLVNDDVELAFAVFPVKIARTSENAQNRNSDNSMNYHDGNNAGNEFAIRTTI